MEGSFCSFFFRPFFGHASSFDNLFFIQINFGGIVVLGVKSVVCIGFKLYALFCFLPPFDQKSFVTQYGVLQ